MYALRYATIAGVLLESTLVPSLANHCSVRKLSESPAPREQMGQALAIDVDWIMVAALGDADYLEGVHCYHKMDGAWVRTQVLSSPLGAVPQAFGMTLALHGNRLILGAPYWQNPTVIDGIVYVYELDTDGQWRLQHEITPVMIDPDEDRVDFFGGAIAFEGNTALIGAHDRSVAFAFERQSDGTWLQTQQLMPDDGRGYFYGRAIALSGNLAVIGAPQDFHVGSWAGSAYVLHRTDNGEWVTIQKLLPTPPSFIGNFGFSVAIDDQQNLIIGEDNGAVDGESGGIVHVYAPTKDGLFEYRQRIVCPSYDRSANFGRSIAVDRDLLIAGADHWNGPMFGNGGAFIFQRQPDGFYRQTGPLMAPDGQDGDWLGNQVAISGDTAVVGALYRDEAGFEDAGAAYAFHISRDDDGDGAMDDCQCALDTNFDGVVNVTDLAFTLSNIGRSGPEVGRTYGDFDNDRDTDLTDLAILLAGFGSACE